MRESWTILTNSFDTVLRYQVTEERIFLDRLSINRAVEETEYSREEALALARVILATWGETPLPDPVPEAPRPRWVQPVRAFAPGQDETVLAYVLRQDMLPPDGPGAATWRDTLERWGIPPEGLYVDHAATLARCSRGRFLVREVLA